MFSFSLSLIWTVRVVYDAISMQLSLLGKPLWSKHSMSSARGYYREISLSVEVLEDWSNWIPSIKKKKCYSNLDHILILSYTTKLGHIDDVYTVEEII